MPKYTHLGRAISSHACLPARLTQRRFYPHADHVQTTMSRNSSRIAGRGVMTLRDKHRWERDNLSPFAQKSYESLGRKYPETRSDPLDNRTEYEHDIDRIAYTIGFNRLSRKTQVFVDPVSDDIHTRIYHVIKVSRIVVDICSYLRLNAQLGEAISLGHDNGHAPFGHEGERVLSVILKDKLGEIFRHEWNSIRDLTVLERSDSYPDRPGINLTGETLDGIGNHCGEHPIRVLSPRPKPRSFAELTRFEDPDQMPATLEGAVMHRCDILAYSTADYRDGVNHGIFVKEELPRIVIDRLGTNSSQMLHVMVNDMKTFSLRAIEKGKPAIGLSEYIYEALDALLAFNRGKLYHNDGLKGYTAKAQHCLTALFDYYTSTPDNPRKRQLTPQEALDYIASMTDRKAINEYARIFNIAPTL